MYCHWNWPINRAVETSTFPGIDDHCFITESASNFRLMTKKNIRVIVLSQLQLQADECLWDIGAGCGAVSVEHLLAQASHIVPLKVICKEWHVLKKIVHCLACPTIWICCPHAPEGLISLPAQIKFYWRQQWGATGYFAVLLALISPGGCIVSRRDWRIKGDVISVFNTLNKHNEVVESMQVCVNEAEKLSNQTIYRAKLPVSIFKFTKMIES